MWELRSEPVFNRNRYHSELLDPVQHERHAGASISPGHFPAMNTVNARKEHVCLGWPTNQNRYRWTTVRAWHGSLFNLNGVTALKFKIRRRSGCGYLSQPGNVLARDSGR